ncbi:hypothetical protein STENM327S_02875 [Streptomyces tendae]
MFAAGGLAVKVGRDAELLERARRELAVALWLEEAGVPAVRAAEPTALFVDGHPVTVWLAAARTGAAHRAPGRGGAAPARPRTAPPLLLRRCRPASCWAVWYCGCASRAT